MEASRSGGGLSSGGANTGGGTPGAGGAETGGTGSGGISSGGTPASGGDTAETGGADATGGSDPGVGGAGGSTVGTDVTLTIEEEEAGYCWAGGVVESEHAGFTGIGYVNTSNAAGAVIEWEVDSAGGSATLEWRYAAPTDRPASLSIDDTDVATVDFPASGDWTVWTTETSTVNLTAGTSRIRLEAQSADGLANIDSLTITGADLAPGACEANVDIDPTLLVGFATLNGGTNGGEGGQVVTATSYAELQSYAESSTPYVIMVDGTISNGSGGGRINVQSNKSIIGVGSTAFLSGVGLYINNANNVIIQNLRVTLVGTTTPSSVNGGDVISIAGTSRNIWIDHCELYSEDPDVQTDIDKYDGLIDIKGQTGFITISYCYLHDHHKGGLVGAADDDLYDDRKVTFHHNFYNKVKLRIPMYRGSIGHFFNNYIVGAGDATEIRAGTCVRVENNYYEALHYSIYTPTDAEGSTERINNIEVSHTSRAYPPDCVADIPYAYGDALTGNTQDIPSVVPQLAGVGKI